jgi:hypothetical protein
MYYYSLQNKLGFQQKNFLVTVTVNLQVTSVFCKVISFSRDIVKFATPNERLRIASGGQK